MEKTKNSIKISALAVIISFLGVIISIINLIYSKMNELQTGTAITLIFCNITIMCSCISLFAKKKKE